MSSILCRAGVVAVVLMAAACSPRVNMSTADPPEPMKAPEAEAAVEPSPVRPSDPDSKAETSGLGEITLRVAARSCDAKIVKAMLDAGVNVDGADEQGNTPLMESMVCESIEVPQILLDAGADVNARNALGHTALMSAAEFGNADVARLLVARGADVNLRNRHGGSALHVAAYNGHLPVVRLLVEAGADRQARDDRERTPLDLAQAQGHEEIAAYLEAAGAPA